MIHIHTLYKFTWRHWSVPLPLHSLTTTCDRNCSKWGQDLTLYFLKIVQPITNIVGSNIQTNTAQTTDIPEKRLLRDDHIQHNQYQSFFVGLDPEKARKKFSFSCCDETITNEFNNTFFKSDWIASKRVLMKKKEKNKRQYKCEHER